MSRATPVQSQFNAVGMELFFIRKLLYKFIWPIKEFICLFSTIKFAEEETNHLLLCGDRIFAHVWSGWQPALDTQLAVVSKGTLTWWETLYLEFSKWEDLRSFLLDPRQHPKVSLNAWRKFPESSWYRMGLRVALR